MNAWAVGLGDIELLSRYSQPFAAKVPVVVAESDQIVQPSDLQVRLLPLSTYEQMGLAQPPLSTESVQVRVTGSGQAYWIELNSAQRVREPMMTLLLEIRHGGVRVIRELPVLFDLPSNLQAPAVAVISAAEPVQRPGYAEPMVEDRDAGVSTHALIEVAAVSEPTRIVADKPATKPVSSLKSRTVQAAPRHKNPKKTPEPPRFRLAEWNQSGQPPTMTVFPRFRMAEQFSSYRELAQAGQAPAPVSAPSTVAAGQAPQAVPAATPAIVSPEVPAHLKVPAEEGSGWMGWTLLTSLGLGLAVWMRRRRYVALPSQPTQAAEGAEPVVTLPEDVPAMQSEPEVESPQRLVQDLPTSVPVVAVSNNGALVELKRRLAALQARSGTNMDLLRKAQLVEAYLDLQRLDSAHLLLAELEGEADGVAKPKFTLIKG